MLVVDKIYLHNFRSHLDKEYIFDQNVTVIVGKNGSGKTTILEAVYYILQGKSFKGSDKEILNNTKDWWKIEAVVVGDKKTVSFDNLKNLKKKKYIEDNHTHYRMPPKSKYPVVLFEPEDLRLLNGSPSRRRRFLDLFISQLDINYSSAVRKYERALKQRNNLLKQSNVSKDDLFVWNIALSEYGSYVIEQRVRFIEQINKHLSDKYQQISSTKDDISAHYSHTLIEHTKQKLFSELEKSFEKDRILKTTTVGPHRHDMYFMFNNSPALSVASRGEIRTIVLALKFIEVEIIQKLDGRNPVILLDDVFSELDEDRQKALHAINNNLQIIITTTIQNSKLDKYRYLTT